MLTQKDLHEAFNYDPDTGKLTWRIKKPHVKVGDIAGNTRTRYITINGYQIKPSRVIWYYTHGYLPKSIDHLNGNRTDLRLDNLYDPDL